MTAVTLPERVAARRVPSVDVLRVLLTVLAAHTHVTATTTAPATHPAT